MELEKIAKTPKEFPVVFFTVNFDLSMKCERGDNDTVIEGITPLREPLVEVTLPTDKNEGIVMGEYPNNADVLLFNITDKARRGENAVASYGSYRSPEK